MGKRRVMICGGGASGALLTSALARAADAANAANLSVTVIGSGGPIGHGIAYATRNTGHLLNVPAGRMSAVPPEPDHFLRWLERRGIAPSGWAGQFVPRALYADYLEDLVRESRAGNPALQIELVEGEVLSLIRDRLEWIVASNKGAPRIADIVILATGNDRPTPVRERHAPDVARRIIDDPWGEFDIAPDEAVLILGSALTAVDAVISLLDRGHRGAIHLLSRHGLLPAAHVQPLKTDPLPAPLPHTAHELLAALRRAAGDAPAQWQGLMDAMRPLLPQIWQALPDAQKRRFLRHGATYWSIHRHRLAPQVAQRLHRALGDNVHVLKGRLAGLAARGDTLEARIAGAAPRTLSVQRVINCTGPNADPNKSHDPLIENLIASRQARATPVGIGLDVDEKNRVRDADGAVQLSLFAMGALTRGRWWEITAIPEISRQAGELSGHILSQLSILDAAQRSAQPVP